MNDTNTKMSLNIESKASLLVNSKKNDLESIDMSTNRIGTDTTLWDILQNDENIILFVSLCGLIYQSNPKKSFFRNTLFKAWHLCLICCIIVGEAGYIYSFVRTFRPQDNCAQASYAVINTVSACIKDLFVIIILPPSQCISILYSLSSIRNLLNQSADMDSLTMYQSSLQGSWIYLITMVLNVFIVFIVIIGFNDAEPCLIGPAFCMILFDFSITCYTSFVVFILSANINRITTLQEEILVQAKNGTLTYKKYQDHHDKINKLNKTVYWSTQILIMNALLNVIAWILSYLALGTIYQNTTIATDIYFLYADSALFLKELIFSIFIALKSVKINTLSDDLSDTLSKSDWLTNGNIEKDHMRLSLFIYSNYDPVSFKIFNKRISNADIYAYMVGILSAFLGKIIQKAVNSTTL